MRCENLATGGYCLIARRDGTEYKCRVNGDDNQCATMKKEKRNENVESRPNSIMQ